MIVASGEMEEMVGWGSMVSAQRGREAGDGGRGSGSCVWWTKQLGVARRCNEKELGSRIWVMGIVRRVGRAGKS